MAGNEPFGKSRSFTKQKAGSGLAKGVVQGWKAFWNHELEERKELGLPPYSYLLEIKTSSLQQKSDMISRMEERGLFPMDRATLRFIFG